MEFADLAREQLPRRYGLARQLVGEDAEDLVVEISQESIETWYNEHPEHVAFAVEVDADRDINGPVRDVSVADLHVDRIDQDHRIDPLERPRSPGIEFVDDLVGDLRDQLFRHLGGIDFREVGLDFTGRQAFGIEADDRLVEALDPAGVLRDDLRLERSGPIPRSSSCRHRSNCASNAIATSSML